MRLLLVLMALGASDPFARFDLPDEWEARFWASPDAHALLKLEPKALIGLIPAQAGLRFCRCPGCDASETDDPLGWSIRKPDILTCKRCEATYPNEKVPAQTDKKIPEEAVEVARGITHKYPYHAPDAEHQHQADERLYLAARRDYEAREYLTKAALYSAVRYRDQPPGQKDPKLARTACLILLRFAQVYPNYAIHLDQPGQPKFFEPARRPPPYRRGYGTAKWDWSGSLDVPIHLVIAYAIVRDDPEMASAGKLLKDPDPKRTIEDDLFRASAAFVLDQPREVDERSVDVARGLLAVGRLLNDEELIAQASSRISEFADRGFFHDGFWRDGDATTHRRVVANLEGWLDRLQGDSGPSKQTVPILALAKSAGAAVLTDRKVAEVQQVGWPASEGLLGSTGPTLLGGVGIARLSVGQGPEALDLELRGMGQFGSDRSRRQVLRLAIGGKTVLGDLDELPPRPDGWDRASASHNTVIVDGLNHRETPRVMRLPAPGGDFPFFAADPDFQVAVLDDPRAYPRVTEPGGFRQTVVVCAGPKSRYAVSVFDVRGGLAHDQFYHAPAGSKARWAPTTTMKPGPTSLLPANIPYVAGAPAEDGRWFVQAYGEFARMSQAIATRPAAADLRDPDGTGLRLHFLGDAPFQVLTAMSPKVATADDPGRSAIMIRRRSETSAAMASTFVTVFEPIGIGPSFAKVGRMSATPGFVVLYLETADGPEHLVINLRPGASRTVELADGRALTTDGVAVRARRDELMLAGGTVASASGVAIRQPLLTGRILASARYATLDSRGWFETDAVVPADTPGLVGRTLSIRHGDGTSHAWTLARVEAAHEGRVRLHVREEPGFLIEGDARAARYYQFPGTTSPGPHTFTLSTIAR